jgi:hypothetical protein
VVVVDERRVAWCRVMRMRDLRVHLDSAFEHLPRDGVLINMIEHCTGEFVSLMVP